MKASTGSGIRTRLTATTTRRERLSATLHTVEYATQSSPIHIALYRQGEFSAQGTPRAGAFVSLRHDDCTDDSVAVRFRIPGKTFPETNSVHNINYTYRDGQIYWSGDWPFDEGPPVPGPPRAIRPALAPWARRVPGTTTSAARRDPSPPRAGVNDRLKPHARKLLSRSQIAFHEHPLGRTQTSQIFLLVSVMSRIRTHRSTAALGW